MTLFSDIKNFNDIQYFLQYTNFRNHFFRFIYRAVSYGFLFIHKNKLKLLVNTCALHLYILIFGPVGVLSTVVGQTTHMQMYAG